MAKFKNQKRYARGNDRQTVKTMLIIAGALFAVGMICIVLAAVLPRVQNEGTDGGATTAATTIRTTAATTTTQTTSTTKETTTTTKQTTTEHTYKTVIKPDDSGRYVQPKDAVWYLKLANDWNTLPENYESTFKAVEYGEGLGAGLKFDSRAVDALRKMIRAANKEDPSLKLRPVSCFRPASYQKTLYWNEVAKWKGQGYDQESAEIKAATVVKRPGQSEHNTGLAVDVGGSGNYSLSQDFENTASFKWLYENCADYGFVLRFPKGKEDITGVIYEPWHYRYVGKKVAKEIMSKKICLEEYLEKTGQ